MEFSGWLQGILQERLGETLDVSKELESASNTELLIGKVETVMSKDEFKDLISKASTCAVGSCDGKDFVEKCENCKIHEFTSKFAHYIA